jgi:replicative DNA helicase
MVDYLQYITPQTTNKTYNRHHEVSAISRALKFCAKDNDIPITCLAQLARTADEEEKKGIAPDMRHFKESGDIEQDADLMFTLYRPEYWGLTEYLCNTANLQSIPQGGVIPASNLLVTKLIKHRNGVAGVDIFHEFNLQNGLVKPFYTI